MPHHRIFFIVLFIVCLTATTGCSEGVESVGDVPTMDATDTPPDGSDAVQDINDIDVASPGCASDLDCKDQGQICDPLPRTCVACLFDHHCGVGMHCHDRECVPYVECSDSSECSPPKGECDTQLKECVECRDADDCQPDAECEQGACVSFTSCSSTVDCPGALVCEELAGRCVGCVSEADCAGTAHCVESECRAYTPCNASGECEEGTFCDESVEECRQCGGAAGCPERYHCLDGWCELDMCVAGQRRCLGAWVEECDAEGTAFSRVEECEGTACSEVGLSARCGEGPVCTAGVHCVGARLVTCSEDGSIVLDEVDCSASGLTCVDGECLDLLCSPGERICVSEDAVHICDVDGLTSTLEDTCDENESCAQGSNGASCECDAGLERCFGVCSDTLVDPNNCGACGTSCGTGESCSGGGCLPVDPTGSCDQPIPLAVGASAQGSTVSPHRNHEWSQACINKAGGVGTQGAEWVYSLNVSGPASVRIRVTANDPTQFALYLRGECANPETELHSICGATDPGTGSYEVTTVLAPGLHYLFVDQLDGVAPGGFRISVESVPVPACGGQVPRVVDVSGAPASLTGDTAFGTVSERWLEFHCPHDAIQSIGREEIFLFALRLPSLVNITAMPTNPNDSLLALYVRQICSVQDSQVLCGFTSGNSTAVVSATLPAGAYSVFVDDFAESIDTTQEYAITFDAQ